MKTNFNIRKHIFFAFTLFLLSCSEFTNRATEEFLYFDGKYDVYILRGQKLHQAFARDSLGVLVARYLIDDSYKRHGTYTEYFSNGSLKREVNKIDNKNHGKYREYYIDGTLRIEGSYHLNSQVGEFLYYNEDGSLHAIEEYESGRKTVLEFTNEYEPNHIIIYPNIKYSPELPALNDTLTISVSFSEQAVKRFKRPMVGYVLYDLIHIDSPEIPDILGPPTHMFSMDENQLDIRYIIYYCSPNSLFYGYTILVDTVSKDTLEMLDFFEVIKMNCLDL